MPNTFSHSLHHLAEDNLRHSTLSLIAVIIFLIAWLGWAVFANVSIYETAASARLEVNQAVFPIESPIAGRVIATNLAVGREVTSGELLVELDTKAEILQKDEEQDRVQGLASQIDAIYQEIKSEEETGNRERKAAQVEIEEARSRYREADSAAKLAEEEARRQSILKSQGLVSEMELIRAKTAAERQRVAAETMQISIERLAQEQSLKESTRKTQIERLQRDATELKAEINTKQTTIARIENETERRRIRAPMSGPLGEVVELKVGSYVREGDKLGVIVPSGELKVVAFFPPKSALGRIYPGQSAKLRLDGFPWTQYGSIPAKVKSVASEARDDQIRVELLINTNLKTPIPLQHGLPGAVEVEIEQVAPVTLVLRIAGKLLSDKKDSK